MSDLNTPLGGHASGSTGGMRPIDPHAQMAYDNAKRLRQASQDHAKKQRDEYARNSHHRPASGALPGAIAPKSDPFTLKDYKAIANFGLTAATIGGFTLLLVVLWKGITGEFHPSNPIVVGILQHGVWGVGFAGLSVGIAFMDVFNKIAKFILILAALLFGAALVYGLYQGLTGAG
jgi:hypothetical protein